MAPDNGKFSLHQPTAYARWREQKLAQADYPPMVDIENSEDLPCLARDKLLSNIRQRNFSLFRLADASDAPQQRLDGLGRQLGLHSLDTNICADDNGLTAITVKQTETDNTYIPYTNRPLGWHTDGYYNAADRQIHAWLLYCAQPAVEGGENELLDHEIAYIRLRDQNPDWIRALTAADAFTIPQNVENGKQIRPAHTGPVFSLLADGTVLHMRYSARQRNIVWKDDKDTRDAANFLLNLFSSGDDHILRYKLAAGEGLISNNILHRRDGFLDGPKPDQKRLIYRARYYDRLAEN